MQYPQIQFYRGSLVRLASGRLKQVEELNSEDFLESAQLLARTPTAHGHSPLWAPSEGPSPAGWQDALGQHKSRLGSLDENNNNTCSVFNSPEPAASDSPTPMDFSEAASTRRSAGTESDSDSDELVDVVSPIEPVRPKQLQQASKPAPADQPQVEIDLSVVRDFLEVGPPGSATHKQPSPVPLTSNQPSPRSADNLTVLIKFFLESSRSVVFIEVPTEHPFFVFHRGWSSWNPQRTYDKFGLKCRKLKIGDTCISLIRRLSRPQSSSSSQHSSPDHIRPPQVPAQSAHSLQGPGSSQILKRQLHTSLLSHQPSYNQQESDCNILFSSIKINE